MRRFLWAVLAMTALTVAGCSSVRKLSRVESRQPAAARKALAISTLRASLAAFSEFAKTCPAEIRELLPELSEERVNFPPCPSRLGMDFAEASPYLGVEARTLIENVLSSQCRNLSDDSSEDPLSSLLEDFDTGSAAARMSGVRGERQLSAAEDNSGLLKRLKAELEEVRNLHLPLEQWTKRYGEFVLAEEELEFLEKLVIKEHCRLGSQEVDQSYRTIRSLEELVRLQREGDPQKQRIERFLAGVHKIIDLKLQEFFKP